MDRLALLSVGLTILSLGVQMLGAELPGAAELAPPVQMTNEQDHRRTMELLGIESLRRGVDGMNPNAPNAANYDEAKANPFPELPDPLKLKNGQPVTTAEMWWNQRRPEIVEDFDREIYGRMPAKTPKVNWEVRETKRETIGGIPAITKVLVGHVDNSSYPLVTVDIDMTLTTPEQAAGPVPVMMEFGFSFGPRRPTTGPGTRPAATRPTTRPNFPMPQGPSWQQQVLSKGWGYAILMPYTVQADNGAGLTSGIIGLCNKGQPRKVDDWGALKAWAWGASRGLDYLETDPAVDAKQVGIEGLSRFGKAAMVTMAYDQRFAIALVGSSGAGGAKLHRRNAGEVVENVASSGEYHWMAGNYLKYAGPLTWGDMPVDSHQLIALCAPRPVLIGCGIPKQGDGWVDGPGMFMATVAAEPVYRLLGAKGVGTDQMPPVDQGLMEGELAWRQHSGGHTNGPNWPAFLEWAGGYIKGPATQPAKQ